MSNAVSALIFACRNVDKTQNGDIGRAPVAAAQGMKVLGEVARYNKAIAKGADATISVFDNIAKHNKAVYYAVKGVKWGVRNVNPMICGSSVLKVAMSDDKTETAIKEVAALSTMFAGEGIAKKLLSNCTKNGIKIGRKLCGTKNAAKIGGRTGAIIKGLLFVGASIGSYSVGEYFGKDLAKDVKASLGLGTSKINQMA